MAKTIFSKRLWILASLALIIILQSTNAFARDMGRERPREAIKAGHQTYHYRDGRFYKPGWLWFEIALVRPPIGVVVTFLPFGHRTVVIGGLTYYYYDNIYYQACPLGYVVVPVPVESQNVIATQNLSGEKVAVNIPNSNGSYTTIILVKQKDGYIGPQGEYYPGNPTIEQLRALYAK
jgi:hypothetical protein